MKQIAILTAYGTMVAVSLACSTPFMFSRRLRSWWVDFFDRVDHEGLIDTVHSKWKI